MKTVYVIDACALIDAAKEYNMSKKTFSPIWEAFDQLIRNGQLITSTEIQDELKDDDLLLITADHGNDPTWIGTDHTREKVPLIAYSKSINKGKYLGEKDSFADIGLTIINNFNINKNERMIGKPINEIIYEN
jgi:phosphopentomutase